VSVSLNGVSDGAWFVAHSGHLFDNFIFNGYGIVSYHYSFADSMRIFFQPGMFPDLLDVIALIRVDV
jgi:hypothetical protein